MAAFRDFLQTCVFLVSAGILSLLVYSWFDYGHDEKQFKADCIALHGEPVTRDKENICVARPYERIELIDLNTPVKYNGDMTIGRASVLKKVP